MGHAVNLAVDDLERTLASTMRLLTDRATVGEIARRSGYDLPPASWSLLEHLGACGALRVSAIAARNGVDISSVTPRLKRMETAGLVTRAREEKDARAFLISITDRGIHALDSVHAARAEILDRAVDGIAASQLMTAAGVLARISGHLMTDTTAAD